MSIKDQYRRPVVGCTEPSRLSVAVNVYTEALKHAARRLRRDWGLTATILLSFSAGIGANVATFSVLDRALFQAPTGVKDATSVHRLVSRERVWGGPEVVNNVFSIVDFRSFATTLRGYGRIEGYSTSQPRALDRDRGLVTIASVSPGYFDILGVHAARGRTFAADDYATTTDRGAIISYELWQTVYGADPRIIGRRITADTASLTIIGVASPGFSGVDLDRVDVWTPRESLVGTVEGGAAGSGSRSLHLLARLSTGRDLGSMDRMLTEAYRNAHRHDAWFDSSAKMLGTPLLEARGPTPLRATTTRSLAFAKRLFGIALVVLAVSMANVASLLLMRTLRRSHEVAVRVALGISRRRLVLETLLEVALLAALACFVAAIVGGWGGSVLRSMLLFDVKWSADGLSIRPLLVAIVLASVMALGVGFTPLAIVFGADLSRLMKSAAGATHAGGRIRATLLVAQTAMCFTLLGLAGAFLQSLHRSERAGVGFDPDVLITIDLSGTRARPDQVIEFASRVRQLPEVIAVSNASSDLRPGSQRGQFAIQAAPPVEPHLIPSFTIVDGSYFDAVGIKLARGRGLSDVEVMAAEPIVVINERMAKMFWPRSDPIGACVYAFGNNSTCRTVAGVARDVRWNVADQTAPHFFVPASQMGSPPGTSVVVRTNGVATRTTVSQVETLVESTFGRQGRSRVQLVTDRLAPFTKPWRAAAVLFALFGALAVLSTAIGIFGLISYDVSQRIRELGIRRALGGTARTLVLNVVRFSLQAIGAGLVVGVALTVIGSQLIRSYLYDASTADTALLLAVSGLIIMVAAVASAVPAYRAAQVDPAIALRAD